MQYVDGASMEDHINEMSNLFQNLRDLGEENLTDSWQMAFLLSSLPESFDTLIIALETRSEKELTLELVESKLIHEWKRRSGKDEVSNSVLKTGNFK
jgi:hypothetical protein